MKIFPAIDLRDGKVVRLLKGDYDSMTVYSDNPVSVAKGFEADGAEYLHVVDLDGAKDGKTPNFDVVRKLVEETGMKVEVGGGIRTEEIIRKYIECGVMRVILGTAAVTDKKFTADMIGKYGDKIAVGVDISGRMAAIKGWTEVSEISVDEMFAGFCEAGVKTIICTDISKDGVMEGTNRRLYEELSRKYHVDIVASGGVSAIEDIKALADMNIYGAIIGKALYTGAVDLKEGIEVARR